MFLQFAFPTIIFIIWPMYPLAIAQDHIIAQPGCDSRCGTIDIAYPFGMKDPKCYADKWFEIECRNTTSSSGGDRTPYLKSINLEVTAINEIFSTVEIMNPVFRWNCQGKTDKPTIILRGSPFVYSQDENKFVAVGCNNLAFLRSNGSTVGGCVSICDDNEEVNNDNINLGNDGCHGRYCCETSLPVYLSEYNATLEDLRNKSVSDECSYALIVSDDWLQNYYMYDMQTKGFSELKNMDYVPAVLEWEILNDMLINSTLKLPSDSYCFDSNVTASSQNKTSGRRCRCSWGSYGDPYIARSYNLVLHVSAIPGFFGEKSRWRKWAIVGTYNLNFLPIRSLTV